MSKAVIKNKKRRTNQTLNSTEVKKAVTTDKIFNRNSYGYKL